MISGRRSLLIAAALAAFVAACGDSPTPPVVNPPVDETPVAPPVLLLSPEPAGRFVQNDPTIGCPAHSARGYGFRVSFDWEDVDDATGYDLTFWQKDAIYAAITTRVTESEFAQINCTAFVIDRNLDNWMWTVRAFASVSVETDSGLVTRDTILSSEERVFGFHPCRLGDGRPCYAPPAVMLAGQTR